MAASANEHGAGLAVLGQVLAGRRDAILEAWRAAIRRDATLDSARALSRLEINDHVPDLLADFERELLEAGNGAPAAAGDAAESADLPGREDGASDAAAHGLQRWQQGYELIEVTIEMGLLNECMCAELDRCAAARPVLSPAVMTQARSRWARAFTAAMGHSTVQYQRLQQFEAAGHIEELESALDDLLELERLRAALWQQAAHDLRGNVAVVANATEGLAVSASRADMQQRFLQTLQRNVAALNHLLNDVTTLARLQAGEEQLKVAAFDVADLLQELGHGMRGLAEQRKLSLRCDGPSTLVVEGDAVKTRRIAQNLILNALTYTRQGGVEVSWGDAPGEDAQRWMLVVRDTGPGLSAGVGVTLAGALKQATAQAETASGEDARGVPAPDETETSRVAGSGSSGSGGGGEGLGLSICKRLCDLLDATVEVESKEGVGTTFRILMPRSYTD